ncbi:MAG: prepilin peptidase, partial [bacterium]
MAEIKHILLSIRDFIEILNPWILGLIIFFFGAIFGSFINVLIYRLPLEMDIVFKPSFCPNCKNPIKWYHNIPIFSYIFLRGKCAYCKQKISISYLLVEVFTAFSFLGFFILFGISWDFFVLCFFFVITFPILVIDFKYHIIPDELSIGGAVLGLILAVFNSFIGFQNNINISYGLNDSIFGALIGILIFGGIYFVSLIVFRKEGMGMGDVKFAATIGIFLGAPAATLSFFLSFLYGSLFGLIIVAIRRFKNRKKIKILYSVKNLNVSVDYLSSIV